MFLGSDGLTHQSTMSEYCLRWNNHQPNLVAVFSELLHSEALVDVTLATDGHFIHAHKLVLSACSMYFKDLFASNPCKHPIVILKDIKIDDLKTVIDFIYRGEVNVSQDRLQDVLKTAESLRIKGLTENPRSIDDVASQGQRLSSSSLGSQTARQVSSFSEQSLSIEGDDDKVETTSSTGPKKRKLPPSMGSSESVYDNDSENNDEKRIKDEPTDEKVLPRDRSRETDSDHSVSAVAGAMIMLQQQGIEGGEEASSQGPSGGDPGTSASHAQGQNWTLPLHPWWATVLPAFARQRSVAATAAGSAVRPPMPPLPPSMKSLSGHLAPSSGGSSIGSSCGSPSSSTPLPAALAHLDKLTMMTTIGKEVSPQMLQALEAVATKRESFSSAAKLYSVSVTTLWRYFKKLGLSEPAHK